MCVPINCIITYYVSKSFSNQQSLLFVTSRELNVTFCYVPDKKNLYVLMQSLVLYPLFT